MVSGLEDEKKNLPHYPITPDYPVGYERIMIQKSGTLRRLARQQVVVCENNRDETLTGVKYFAWKTISDVLGGCGSNVDRNRCGNDPLVFLDVYIGDIKKILRGRYQAKIEQPLIEVEQLSASLDVYNGKEQLVFCEQVHKIASTVEQGNIDNLTFYLFQLGKARVLISKFLTEL